jgi:cell division initiation protein
MTAQQMVEDYKTNARKEAELLLKDAETKADIIIREAHEKVIKIHEDITDMKGIRRHFKEELRRLIENHLKMIEFDERRDSEDKEVVSE